MRKIKFRAWDDILQEMVTQEESGLLAGQILRRYSVIMQYTGLEDKNGREIYEGDILRQETDWRDEYWQYGVVMFDNGCFEVTGLPLFEWLDMEADHVELEVAGNIHETPELLIRK